MSRPTRERILSLPPEDQKRLRERAAEIARGGSETAAGEPLEVLELHCRGEAFALPVECVLGVIELTSLAPVPRAPFALKGLVSFRGEVLVGYELGALVGGDAAAGIADLRRLVAVDAGSLRLALLAERAEAVRTVDRTRFAPVEGRPAWVVGTDPEFLHLLDPAALLARAVELTPRAGA